MTAWRAITSLGDSALLLPLIAWIAICLFWSPATRRDGWRWVFAAACCGGVVVLSKLLFMAWGIGPPGLNYTGFSGHTALAILAWPSLAGLLAREMSRSRRISLIAVGAIVGIAVALSRLALKVHSPSEVWLGAVAGAVVVTWFLAGVGRTGATPLGIPARQSIILACGALLVGFLCYGRVFPSQHLLQDIALWLSGHPNVFTRRMRLG